MEETLGIEVMSVWASVAESEKDMKWRDAFHEVLAADPVAFAACAQNSLVRSARFSHALIAAMLGV